MKGRMGLVVGCALLLTSATGCTLVDKYMGILVGDDSIFEETEDDIADEISEQIIENFDDDARRNHEIGRQLTASEVGTHELSRITLDPQAGNSYDASNLFDGNINTAWAIGERKYKKLPRLNSGFYDVWVDMRVNGSPTKMKIRNGYCKSADSWRKNARVKGVEVVGYQEGGDISANLYGGVLEDTDSWQTISLDTSPGETFDYVRLRVNSIYPGTMWQDVCISEIEFY